MRLGVWAKFHDGFANQNQAHAGDVSTIVLSPRAGSEAEALEDPILDEAAEGEREFRIRPRRPRTPRENEAFPWSPGMRTVVRYARSSRRRQKRRATSWQNCTM